MLIYAGRPIAHVQQAWTCATEKDIGVLNVGLDTEWRRAQNRQNWREIVEMATL